MFSLASPDSKSVASAGAFNNWEPEAMLRGPDGVWRITVQLAHGTYEYRFLADGVWMQDANNPRRQANDLGGYDSVCNVL
jgi:1,4-alpha-glucan branching enzyme